MMKTIQTALTPLLIIASFYCLGLFEYPLGQPRPYLTCLYILTTWSFFVYLFCFLVYNSQTSFMYLSWNYVIEMIAAIISMLVSLYRYKELKICLHKLSIVDDTLEALGTLKEYQRLRNWINRMIIGWIIISFFILDATDSIILNYEYFSIARIFVPFLGNHLMNVITLNTLILGTMLGYTSSRFQRVNERIHALYSDLLKNNADCTRTQNKLIFVNQWNVEIKERKKYMWIIMHIHLQLCLISRDLNKVFNVQMSLQMICYFWSTVLICYEIYSIYINKNAIMTFQLILDRILTYFYGIVYNITIITLNYICQTIYYKINETVAILYKLSNYNLDEDLREQILQFILQIKQRELKFGMGRLYFGYNLIRQLYKSVVTVLVIAVQMI